MNTKFYLGNWLEARTLTHMYSACLSMEVQGKATISLYSGLMNFEPHYLGLQ